MHVIYKGGSKDQCTWRGHDDPRHLLTVGTRYTVQTTRVSDWYTTLVLAEYPHLRLNSVLFEEVPTP